MEPSRARRVRRWAWRAARVAAVVGALWCALAAVNWFTTARRYFRAEVWGTAHAAQTTAESFGLVAVLLAVLAAVLLLARPTAR